MGTGNIERHFSFEGSKAAFDVLVGLGRSRAILSGYDNGGWWDRRWKGTDVMLVRVRGKDVLAFPVTI